MTSDTIPPEAAVEVPPLIRHLDALRDSLEISVTDLALAAETDRTHLWSVFNGRRGASPRLVSRLLIALGQIVEAA